MFIETSNNVIFQNLKLARIASNSVKNNRRQAPSKKTSFSQNVVFYVKNNPPTPSRHTPNLWNPKGRTKRILGLCPYRKKLSNSKRRPSFLASTTPKAQIFKSQILQQSQYCHSFLQSATRQAQPAQLCKS